MNLKKHFDAAETGIQLDRKAGRADITLDVTGDVLHTGLTLATTIWSQRAGG
jgi:hypothetical protein